MCLVQHENGIETFHVLCVVVCGFLSSWKHLGNGPENGNTTMQQRLR